ALMNYEGAKKCFPYSRCNLSLTDTSKYFIPDRTGPLSSAQTNQQSWTVLILPFIEEQGIATQFNFQKPWYDNVSDPASPNAPTNLSVVSNPIKMFICPSTESGRVDATFTSTIKPAAGDYGSVNGVKAEFYNVFPQLGTYPTEGRPPVVGVLNKY